jgi:hypothetical protein
MYRTSDFLASNHCSMKHVHADEAKQSAATGTEVASTVVAVVAGEASPGTQAARSLCSSGSSASVEMDVLAVEEKMDSNTIAPAEDPHSIAGDHGEVFLDPVLDADLITAAIEPFNELEVGQGDVISPLSYIFGFDLLQSAVNDMVHQGTLFRPIETNDADFLIVQYADDTLLILPTDKEQLLALKETLQKFSSSTGLKINYEKSYMVPINVSEERIKQLAVDLGVGWGECLSHIWACRWERRGQRSPSYFH